MRKQFAKQYIYKVYNLSSKNYKAIYEKRSLLEIKIVLRILKSKF